MEVQTPSYEQPSSSVVHIDMEESLLGGGTSDGSGTEPIVDDGSSHGWG